MIAIAPTRQSLQVSHETAEAFEAMLPSIRQVAEFAFRKVRRSLRQEMLADVIANAFAAFVRLVQRGLERLAYPTVFAHFAVRQVWAGRQLGCRQNVLDVMSRHSQRGKGFTVQPLQVRNPRGHWEELVVEDHKATPAEIAAFKLDFSAWLNRLQRSKRRAALRLAAGDTPTEVSRQLKVSRARISKLRRELRQDWDQFQAEPVAA